MERYTYKLAGIYQSRSAAEEAMQHVVASGFARDQVRCAWPDDRYVDRKVEPETKASRNHMIRNAVVGVLVGGAIGLLATVLIALFGPALFTAAPVWGPLIVTGYGAAIGLTVGAFTGLRMREGQLASAIVDEVNRGGYAVIVQARDSREAQRAERLLEERAGEKILH